MTSLAAAHEAFAPAAHAGRAGAASLHVIDPERAGHLATAALAACRGPDDRVLVIGGERAAAMAGWNGLAFDARVPTTLGRAELAWRAAQRLGAAIDPAGERLLTAWSPRCAALCGFAFAHRPLRGVALEADLAGADGWSRLRRRTVRSLGARAVFGSDEIAASWGVRGGVAAEPWLGDGPALRADRASARARWGLDDGAPIVALLGDPPAPLEGRRAMFLVGVLAIAGTPVHGVAAHDAAGIERARRLIERQKGPWSVALDDRPPPHWLGACDAAIAFAGAGGVTPLAVAWGLRAGLPTIVETMVGAASGEREDGAIAVERGAVNRAALLLLEVIEGTRARAPVSRSSDHERGVRSAWLGALERAAGAALVA